ncbi:MAG TPA: hypothetical protein VEO94_09395, partial [Candidatus Dormibacteraeota bacterium]|nr:hypothetical protein [Candidatus Dormibacteraeota bacterium]
MPISSGTGAATVPLVFSFPEGAVDGSFFVLGAGDGNNSGSLPVTAWLVPLGDLDGDGRQEYQIAAPGEGPGGWGDARTTGCPASLSPSHPPLVIILKQAREDLDGDGFFDLFEDLNHNQILDPGEDRDGDGRLTPPFVNTPFGSFRGCEGATREDQDCDGHLDLYYEDKNHNGILDPGEDIDGDNRLDYIDEDRNHNGVLDPGEDRNGNGILDTYDPVNLPYIHPYIEDRNNNGFLDDRVRPLPDDQEFQVTTGPNGEQIRTPISPNYPYGSFRPAAGGIVLASVAWNGSAYDFDAIDTPTRNVTLPDGRRFRMVDSAPLEDILPRFTGARVADLQRIRLHIRPSHLDPVDDARGTRIIIDDYLLSFSPVLAPPEETPV